MALYWPHSNVALDVTDDPHSMPVDTDAFPHIRVVSATCAELRNPALRRQVAERLARAARGSHAPGALSSLAAQAQLQRFLATAYPPSSDAA